MAKNKQRKPKQKAKVKTQKEKMAKNKQRKPKQKAKVKTQKEKQEQMIIVSHSGGIRINKIKKQ